MFGESLLESAPNLRKRRRWPIATAFVLQLAAAAVLILLPLLSTGILPLKATVIFPTPPKYSPVQRVETAHQSAGRQGVSAPVPVVIPIAATTFNYRDPISTDPTDRNSDPPPLNPGGGGDPRGIDLGLKGTSVVTPPPKPPLVVSRTTEAMLLTKVVPEYPTIARLSGIQGDVKLHAFVDKNGNIQSLTVLGNPPPVLSRAALQAVEQWKYRPYYLNGEPVEIETFITVTFRKAN